MIRSKEIGYAYWRRSSLSRPYLYVRVQIDGRPVKLYLHHNRRKITPNQPDFEVRGGGVSAARVPQQSISPAPVIYLDIVSPLSTDSRRSRPPASGR
jgi:uncharacterized protein (DUF736 family)